MFLEGFSADGMNGEAYPPLTPKNMQEIKQWNITLAECYRETFNTAQFVRAQVMEIDGEVMLPLGVREKAENLKAIPGQGDHSEILPISSTKWTNRDRRVFMQMKDFKRNPDATLVIHNCMSMPEGTDCEKKDPAKKGQKISTAKLSELIEQRRVRAPEAIRLKANKNMGKKYCKAPLIKAGQNDVLNDGNLYLTRSVRPRQAEQNWTALEQPVGVTNAGWGVRYENRHEPWKLWLHREEQDFTSKTTGKTSKVVINKWKLMETETGRLNDTVAVDRTGFKNLCCFKKSQIRVVICPIDHDMV